VNKKLKNINDESSYQPLGMRPWYPGLADEEGRPISSFSAELNVISVRTTHDEIARMALMAELGHRTSRNDHSDTVATLVHDESLREAALNGSIAPDNMVALMIAHPQIPSAELGRLTHPGSWRTNSAIDKPIRDALEIDRLLTVTEHGSSSYRITGHYGDNNRYVGIARKRTLYTHWSGAVSTLVKNYLYLDRKSKSLPRELRLDLANCIREECEQGGKKASFDYKQHRDFLGADIESYLRGKNKRSIPEGVHPLGTVYYARQNTLPDSHLRSDQTPE
jgi:hypothetical protein